MIYFDEIDIGVKPKGAANFTGLLAQSCSLSINNQASEVYSAGRRGVVSVTPNGPAEASLSVSYLLESEAEPCFEVVRLLKNHNPSKTRISFAGITGDFYLSKYSFNSNPNQSLSASAQFTCFDLVTGKNAGQFSRHTSSIDYNTTDSITHGWSTYLVESGTHPKAHPTLGLQYSFQARHEPMYVINKQVPSQVDFMAAKESVSTIKTELYNAHVSGITGQKSNLANTGTFSGQLTLAPVLLACRNDKPDASLTIDLSGSHIESTNVSANVSDIVRTQIIANKYF